MTRAEIEKRLHIPLLNVLLAGMEKTALERDRKREAATEQVLNAVEAIAREVELHTTMSIAKSVRRKA
jgi:hypothetical protein